MLALLSFVSFIVSIVFFILFIISLVKKKDTKKRNLIIWLVSLVLTFVFALLSPSPSTNDGNTPGPANESTPEPTVETTVEATAEPKDFDVTIEPSASWDNEKAVFDIKTNLPDETVLMLSISSGDYNVDTANTAQDKVTVKNGSAKSSGFSNKGSKLSGNYDLSISMSIPSTQSEEVRKVIGEKGEYMHGDLVKNAEITDANVVAAMFTVSFDDQIVVTPSKDYQYTVFRENDETEESKEASQDTTSDYDEVEKVKSDLTAKVNQYIDDNYTFTVLDKIEVNPNAGTEESGDYIGLVYLTWNEKNKGEKSKTMLTMYSEDMATRVYDDLPEIQEIAIFWTVPYLNNGNAKLSFERKNNGMFYTDKVFDKNFD